MEELEQSIQELSEKVSSLTQENERLKARELERVKNIHDQFKEEVTTYIMKGDVVQKTFNDLYNNVVQDRLLVSLNRINNPTSNIFGFTFTEIIKESALRHFSRSLVNNQDDRKRFVHSIEKILDHPIVSTILNINPVTSLIEKVIDTARNFFVTKRSGNKIVEIKHDLFEEGQYAEFIKELTVYIELYERLITATHQYDDGVSKLMRSYDFLKAEFKDVYIRFQEILGVRETPHNIFNIFLHDNAQYEEYQRVIEDPKINDAYGLISSFQTMEKQSVQFTRDYKYIFDRYINTCAEVINHAKSLPKAQDTEELHRLTLKIEEFKSQARSLTP